MLVFANSGDVERWLGVPSPAGVDALIRRASGMVQWAVRRARFHTEPSGLPSDPDVSEALRDAVCAQVAYWGNSNVDPTKTDTTAKLASTSLDGASMSFDTATATSVTDQAATTLCHEAWLILENEGLTGGPVWH